MSKHVVPTGDDSIVELTIPIAGRTSPILARVPQKKWMPKPHVQAYNKWVVEMMDLEKAWIEWSTGDESTRGEAPCSKDDLDLSTRDFKLRWIKPYLKAADWKAVDENLSEAAVDYIFDLIEGRDPTATDKGEPEISEGESEASATS